MSIGRQPDYGLDAPGLIKIFFAIGFATVCALLLVVTFVAHWNWWATLLVTVMTLVALYTFGMGCYMIYGSKITKVRECERLLDVVPWLGNEQVLDVGCGRGLMLVKAAKRLTTGRATGIDIWQAEDQSKNSPAAALDNARLEAVEDRVSVETADMRDLPFEAGSFDIIASNWVVHNLPEEADRRRALSEMVRVLRNDGILILSDIEHREQYRAQLAELGLTKQQIVVSPAKDRILSVITFGSFRPAAIIAQRAPSNDGSAQDSLVSALEALSLDDFALIREIDTGRATSL